MSAPFVVVEGLSGTGKSTLARALASRIAGTYLTTPAEPYASIRQVIDAEATPQEHYVFYLASVAGAAREVRRFLERGPVVCDRWLPTAQLWHSLLGVAVLDDLSFLELPEPDVILLVTCREDHRQARLDRRGRDANDVAEAVGDREERLLARYLEAGLVEIDTTELKAGDVPQAVVDAVLLRDTVTASAAA